jgi:regulator of protease activity HflC (stomatin/prohibitin superfamily)
MRNRITFILGLIVAVALLLYAITYTVRFDETAVVTTFEQADRDDLKHEAGLYFKAPWPISKVKAYPKKIQVLELPLSQFQTADDKSVIASLYVTWRVEDAFAFFKSLENFDNARARMNDLADNLNAELSAFSFDELVNPDPGQIRLDEFENRATESLQNSVDQLGFGITIEKVGLRRLSLPEAVSENVFASMRTTREALAASAEQEGIARANQLTSEAESISRRILAFANATATAIRAEGQREAVEQYELFNEAPELAIFLAKLEAIEQILSQQATIILDANEFDLLNLLRGTGESSE